MTWGVEKDVELSLYVVIQSDLICGHIQVNLNRRPALDAYAINENVNVTKF